MVVHAFDPSPWEAEAGVCLWVQGQPGQHCEFQNSQGYVERLFLKKKKQQKNKPNQPLNKKDRDLEIVFIKAEESLMPVNKGMLVLKHTSKVQNALSTPWKG